MSGSTETRLTDARRPGGAGAATGDSATRGAPAKFSAGMLRPGDVLSSCAHDARFLIERRLGKGGFAETYLARVAGRRPASVPDTVCIKVTSDLSSWICEAYFGLLLASNPRAIQLHEILPLQAPGARADGLYALVFEYAPHGDLTQFLERRAAPCSERYVRREMIAVLEVLDVLHRGRALHRDLTPFNVLVCDGDRLKLGDFGIAKHHITGGLPITAWNRGFAPTELQRGPRRRWRARDDVYQVGQLLGMLLKGDAGRRLESRDVRRLRCSDQMKEIIQRCIGVARKRFETASELIEALSAKPRSEPAARVGSLRGQRVVFTGRLAVERAEAARLARRAGAIVENRVTSGTNVVIRGVPSPVQKAGAKGSKLMDVAFWRERGARIAVINEKQFWRLIASTPSAGAKRAAGRAAATRPRRLESA